MVRPQTSRSHRQWVRNLRYGKYKYMALGDDTGKGSPDPPSATCVPSEDPKWKDGPSVNNTPFRTAREESGVSYCAVGSLVHDTADLTSTHRVPCMSDGASLRSAPLSTSCPTVAEKLERRSSEGGIRAGGPHRRRGVQRDDDDPEPPGDHGQVSPRTPDQPSPPTECGTTNDRGGKLFHCHVPRPGLNRVARNQLLAVSILCVLFMIGEIIGGSIANSLALITDATHLASDLSGFLVSLCAIWIAARPPTARMSFGYYRAEVVGALISVLIIWVTTAVLVFLAIRRIIHQNYNIESDTMLITAGAGVAFNVVMGIVLNSSVTGCQSVAHAHSHGHGHSHGHDHSHGHLSSKSQLHSECKSRRSSSVLTSPVSNDTEGENHVTVNLEEEPCIDATKQEDKASRDVNINVRAAFIHVVGDLIQSIGVFIAALIIKFKPEYKLADPICTFVFSVLVLITTITIIRDTVVVLLEAVPKGLNYRMCKFDLERQIGVRSVHSLNVWALTTSKNIITAHIAVDPDVDRKALLEESVLLLRNKYGAFQTTIQLEDYEEETMTSCEDCLGPKLC